MVFSYTRCKLNLILSTCIISLLSLSNSFSQEGLKAEFYDGANFDRLEMVKYVPNINQSWFDIPPVPNIDPHKCSIRFTGKLKPKKSGTYTFSAQVDDGIRVWIDGTIIIDQWDLNDLGRFAGTIELTADRIYDIKVEYFNGMIEGEVRLFWKKNKDELTFYERLFGDGVKPTLIMPEYFLPPSIPAKNIEKEINPPPKKIAKNNVIIQQPPPKPNVVSTPKKKIYKPKPTSQEVSSKLVEKYLPKNVQFEKGKTIILESSFSELNSFIQFMIKYPHLKVMVEGHTDVVGDKELNLALSKDRAKVISNYLFENGIEKNRVKSEGFGGSRPLVEPEEGQYHPENRRVVFIVEEY